MFTRCEAEEMGKILTREINEIRWCLIENELKNSEGEVVDQLGRKRRIELVTKLEILVSAKAKIQTINDQE